MKARPREKQVVVPKQDTDFVTFAYGVVPPRLHHWNIERKYIQKDALQGGIKKVKCGSDHFIILTEKNVCLIGGGNKFGQCGKLADSPVPIPHPPKKVKKSEEEKAEEKKLPKDKKKKEPKESKEKPKKAVVVKEVPSHVNLLSLKIVDHEILDIAAGSSHTMILVKHVSDHRVRLLCMGHELGCGFLDKKHRCEPTEVIIPEAVNDPIAKIFAGQNRSAAVLQSGRLFMWGEWFSGAKQRYPVEIGLDLQGNDQIKKISIGKMHALIVTTNGKLYSIGDNTYGELGEPREVKGRNNPTIISYFDEVWEEDYTSPAIKILDCEAGCRHSLVTDVNGNLYSFGDNSEGQCGLEDSRVYTPKRVEIPEVLGEAQARARFIFAGDSHSCVVTSNGDLYAWGDNSAGRLGIQSNGSVFQPTLVDEMVGRNVCAVGLGGFFSIFVAGDEKHSLLKGNENIIMTEILKKSLAGTGLDLLTLLAPKVEATAIPSEEIANRAI